MKNAVLHLGEKSSRHQQRLGLWEACPGSCSAEKELGGSKLNRKLRATKKGNNTLGCIPFQSALFRTHLDCASRIGYSKYKKDVNELEQVYQRPTKLSGLEHLPCEEVLREVGLFREGGGSWGEPKTSWSVLRGKP